jgi:putative nucleotidyltransferase with HDIG domain
MVHQRSEIVISKRTEAYTASRSLYNSRIVAALVGAVERKDSYTAAHMRAVAQIARLIGLEMVLPAQEIGVLSAGALLHDLGKIAVPNTVLKKPGPLTPEEQALTRLHPVTGANILKHIRVLRPVVPAVRHHHERFDGNGYPEGLSCEEIPLAARVILVADALDAITAARPYQQGVSREEALEEIVRNAGTQFDPEVVEVLLQVEESA